MSQSALINTCVVMHAWWLANVGGPSRRYAYLAENRSWVWIPADSRRDWLQIRYLTDRREWLVGSAAEAAAEGLALTDRWPTGQWQAPHGDFFAIDEGRKRKPGPLTGNWGNPTPQFLASLPTNPERLYERLQSDSPPARWAGFVGPLKHAISALQTGLVPARLRGSLYQALLFLPGVALEDNGTNVAGRSGLALVHVDQHYRTEVMIDPDAGQFIGYRRKVTGNGRSGLKPGAVTASTAVDVSTVDGIGQIP